MHASDCQGEGRHVGRTRQIVRAAQLPSMSCRFLGSMPLLASHPKLSRSRFVPWPLVPGASILALFHDVLLLGSFFQVRRKQHAHASGRFAVGTTQKVLGHPRAGEFGGSVLPVSINSCMCSAGCVAGRVTQSGTAEADRQVSALTLPTPQRVDYRSCVIGRGQ